MSACTFTWLRHAGFSLQIPTETIWIDLYSNGKFSRRTELSPHVPVDHLSTPTILLCTHKQTDRLDPPTVSKLASERATRRFVGPPSGVEEFRRLDIECDRILEVSTDGAWCIEDSGISVSNVPAFHDTPESVGSVLWIERFMVYLTGDTQYQQSIKANFRMLVGDNELDLLLVCVNGKCGNMDCRELAAVTSHRAPRAVAPMQYGPFEENTKDPMRFNNVLEGDQRALCHFLEPWRTHNLEQLVLRTQKTGA